MPQDTQGAHAAGTLDTAALRRKLTNGVWWAGVRNSGIYGLMAFGTPGLGAEAKRAGMSWVPIIGGPMIFVGILGFIATLYTIPLAVIATRTCRKTLAQYSFDTFCPQITKVDGAQATKGRPKSMTLTLRTAEGQESPLMRMNPVPRRGPWRNPWPEGIENGVYVAGDLPFGAVGYVPSSGAFFLMQPEDWDAAAQDRKLATPDRVTRAQDADLTRRII
ncbi:hypothetical protein [Streptomyces jeddahensis]|uniref:Uncharacterized protein n=1 Tax=Streptomyces jeddahensis TaxID=1716141 RepID=A0A177HK19_9ACTN|nr:hypothetical protein [Streptomyces jeddahensis]OAH10727.1 hypothetical protein STSP_59660 [Streptomyces jeddahensis]